MSHDEEFVKGRRYIVGVQPWGPMVVEFLGYVPYWPKKVRVRNPVTFRTAWVDAERLRPVASAVELRGVWP